MSQGFFPILLAFIFSVILTRIFISVCNRIAWMDVPNARSAHSVPVPKGAGSIFIMLSTAVALWLYSSDQITARLLMGILIGVPAGLLGLADDFFNLSIRIRVAVQCLMVILVIVLFGSLQLVPLPWGEWQTGLLGLPLTLLGFIWFFNLFNFMDGMDGLAATEAIFVLSSSMLLTLGTQDAGGQIMNLSLIAVLCGFLVFNLPPAKVFMGDAGSNFLALILIVLFMAPESGLNIWSWIILLGAFIADSSYTLIKRMLTGQVWYHAHKSHSYQKLMIAFESHRKGLLAAVLVNLLWLLPLAWLSQQNPEWGIIITIMAYLPLILVAVRLKAGTD